MLIVAVLAVTVLYMSWKEGQRMRMKFPPRRLSPQDAAGDLNPKEVMDVGRAAVGGQGEKNESSRWGVSLVGTGNGKAKSVGGTSQGGTGGKKLAGQPYQPRAHY